MLVCVCLMTFYFRFFSRLFPFCFGKDLQALQEEAFVHSLFRSSLVDTFRTFLYRVIQARAATKGQ